MDIQEAAFNYLTHIFKTESSPKLLILDKQTMDFISVAITKTEILKNEVFLVETLDFFRKPHGPDVASLTCYCLIRPTPDNIDLLCEELTNPKFTKYCLFFTAMLGDPTFRRIASSDVHSSIELFQEVYLDFSSLGRKLFSLNLPDITAFRMDPSSTACIDRILEGLFGVISSLNVKPIIRYDLNSNVTKPIALGLQQMVQNNKEFNSAKNMDNACVLILDRRNDPATPLMHFFHFFSAIHDLFTISNNIVKIGKNEYIIDERLYPEAEDIGAMFLGDAGPTIHQQFEQLKTLKQPLQEEFLNNEKFLQRIKISDTYSYVSSFVSLSETLFSAVQNQNLLDVTYLEQIIAVTNDPSERLEDLRQILQNPKVTKEAALRLGLIYVLKYEKSRPNAINEVIKLLQNRGPWEKGEMRYFEILIRIAGQDKRTEDIFSNKSIIAKFIQGLSNFQEQKSQYEQFKLPLQKILQDISQNRLNERTYPFIGRKGGYQKTIIFFIGGATYEEQKLVVDFSKNGNHSFVLGGTTIHNADSFLRFEVAPFA